MCNEPNYDEVAEKTWVNSDFLVDNLALSRSLFEFDGLGQATPRQLDVVALVSGLPFSKTLIDSICAIQNDISAELPHEDVYWVLPANLAIEYVVFKWPEDPQLSGWKKRKIEDALGCYRFEAFSLRFIGYQINPDGCVVLKGYDDSGSFDRLRRYCSTSLEFLPKKQSSWFHIPLGRILTPVGRSCFINLHKMVDESRNSEVKAELITSAKLVFERQWYMVDRQVVLEIGAS